jgi:hypothetical protein
MKTPENETNSYEIDLDHPADIQLHDRMRGDAVRVAVASPIGSTPYQAFLILFSSSFVTAEPIFVLWESMATT